MKRLLTAMAASALALAFAYSANASPNDCMSLNAGADVNTVTMVRTPTLADMASLELRVKDDYIEPTGNAVAFKDPEVGTDTGISKAQDMTSNSDTISTHKAPIAQVHQDPASFAEFQAPDSLLKMDHGTIIIGLAVEDDAKKMDPADIADLEFGQAAVLENGDMTLGATMPSHVGTDSVQARMLLEPAKAIHSSDNMDAADFTNLAMTVDAAVDDLQLVDGARFEAGEMGGLQSPHI